MGMKWILTLYEVNVYFENMIFIVSVTYTQRCCSLTMFIEHVNYLTFYLIFIFKLQIITWQINYPIIVWHKVTALFYKCSSSLSTFKSVNLQLGSVSSVKHMKECCNKLSSSISILCGTDCMFSLHTHLRKFDQKHTISQSCSHYNVTMFNMSISINYNESEQLFTYLQSYRSKL